MLHGRDYGCASQLAGHFDGAILTAAVAAANKVMLFHSWRREMSVSIEQRRPSYHSRTKAQYFYNAHGQPLIMLGHAFNKSIAYLADDSDQVKQRDQKMSLLL